MHTKRSVSTRIAKYLFIILIVAGVISSLSLAIISSNKYDAKLLIFLVHYECKVIVCFTKCGHNQKV